MSKVAGCRVCWVVDAQCRHVVSSALEVIIQLACFLGYCTTSVACATCRACVYDTTRSSACTLHLFVTLLLAVLQHVKFRVVGCVHAGAQVGQAKNRLEVFCFLWRLRVKHCLSHVWYQMQQRVCCAPSGSLQVFANLGYAHGQAGERRARLAATSAGTVRNSTDCCPAAHSSSSSSSG
jgi:hypothetical protein